MSLRNWRNCSKILIKLLALSQILLELAMKDEKIAKKKLTINDIKNKKGLHARPSSLFVQLVTKYDSDITVKSEDETVNGKSIMGLMLLAAEEGRELELIADGPDEDAMLEELVDLIEVKKFNEE